MLLPAGAGNSVHPVSVPRTLPLTKYLTGEQRRDHCHQRLPGPITECDVREHWCGKKNGRETMAIYIPSTAALSFCDPHFLLCPSTSFRPSTSHSNGPISQISSAALQQLAGLNYVAGLQQAAVCARVVTYQSLGF